MGIISSSSFSILMIYLFLSLGFATLGLEKARFLGMFFFAAMFLTPLIGRLLVLVSDKKSRLA